MTENPMDFIRETDEIIKLENKVKRLEAELKKHGKSPARNASNEAGAAKSGPAGPWYARIDRRTARNAIILSEIFGSPVSKRRR